MFAARYFNLRYWARRFWSKGSLIPTPTDAVYAYEQGNLFVLPNFIPPPPIPPITVNPKNIIRVARQSNKLVVKRNSNVIRVKKGSNKIIVK